MEKQKNGEKIEDEDASFAYMVHGHVLETAKCRYRILILENLLIKHGLTTDEELKFLYNESLKEKLPEEFNKIEQIMGYPKKNLVFEKDGTIAIKNLE